MKISIAKVPVTIFSFMAHFLLVGTMSFVLAAEKTPVTMENFATAETHRYLNDFTKQGAVNKFIHEDQVAVPLDKQTIIRSNIDMFYSHAVVDVSEGAQITLPNSDGRFRVVQVVDANGYTPDVLYDEGTYELKSNSGAKYVYLLMRTAADPEDKNDQDVARKLMQSTVIKSKGNKQFVSEYNFDENEIVEMRDRIIQEGGKKYTDSFGAFGDVDDIKDHEKFIYGAAAGWGGLPEKEAVYWPIAPNLGDKCAVLTIEPPPVNRYWSITVYDEKGWLANESPLRNINNTTPNDDGTLTFHFGCGDDALNNLPITSNWTYVLRMYGPKEDVLNGSYKQVMPELEGN
jgi:hypothetical protein